MGIGANGTSSAILRFEEFYALIDQLNDKYGFKTKYYVKVVYNTEVTVKYEDKTVTKTLQPYLKISIENMLYQIEKFSEKSDKIELFESVQAGNKPKVNMLILGLVGFGMLAIFAVLLSKKFLEEIPVLARDEKERKIALKYGDRIIEVVDHPDFEIETMRVASITDVVKIADEIIQPVFCSRFEGKIYYYVINNSIMYYVCI